MNGFWFALQFLTRIPVPVRYPTDAEVQRQSFYWHGVVGLVIGAFLWLLANCLQPVLPFPLLTAAIILFAWILMTGALHLDGLGDTADAWLGGYGDKNKTLLIMKDPTSGPAAIVWIGMVLLIKFAAIAALIQQQQPLALLLIPAIARFAGMSLLATTPYVRDKGLGSPLVSNIRPPLVIFQGCVLLLVVLLIFKGTGLVSLLLCTAVVFYLRLLMIRRIEGTTGDTAGALIELIEMTALIGFNLSLQP